MTNEALVSTIQSGNSTDENIMQLYNQNYGIIKKICSKYTYMAELEDLTQEAYFALIKAIKGFSDDEGIKFISYFTKVLQRHLLRFCRENSRTLRMPENELKLLSEYHKFKYDFFKMKERYPTDKEYMRALKLSEAQYQNLIRALTAIDVTSLDEPIPDSEELTVADTVKDDFSFEDEIDKIKEREYIKTAVFSCLNKHSDKLSKVIYLKYWNLLSYKEIADIFGCSIEMIRITVNKALKELRKDRQIKNICNDYFDSYKNYRYGLNAFKTTGISSTEYIAIKREELQERYDIKYILRNII